MNEQRIATIENGRLGPLPADWVEELGLGERAALVRTEEGILIRPCPRLTWDEVFANPLPMPTDPPVLDLSEISGDDLLF
jgi:hypothetical protein